LLTLLAIIKMIIECHEILSGSITIYCDNQGALDNVSKKIKRGGYSHYWNGTMTFSASLGRL
jgi:hypothetical protein